MNRVHQVGNIGDHPGTLASEAPGSSEFIKSSAFLIHRICVAAQFEGFIEFGVPRSRGSEPPKGGTPNQNEPLSNFGVYHANVGTTIRPPLSFNRLTVMFIPYLSARYARFKALVWQVFRRRYDSSTR